jgi:hypothetical protein
VIQPKVRGLLSRPPVARQVQIDNAWDPVRCGRDVSLTDDGMTCRLYYCGGRTAAVRGRRPMTTGVHVWAVTWNVTGDGGAYPIIGVGTDKAAMDDDIGHNADSWGWHLNHNNLRHDGQHVVRYPNIKDPDSYSVPYTFHLVLDMDEGTLSFVDGDEYLGVAFSGLRGRSLYVMAGLWTGEQVSIKYHGGCP